MGQILGGITQAAGGSYKLEYSRGYPSSVNNTALVERTLPSLERSVGKENVLRGAPSMAADDFAYFAKEVPAFFFRLGTVKPGTTSGNNHTPTFMADDGAIPVRYPGDGERPSRLSPQRPITSDCTRRPRDPVWPRVSRDPVR